MNKQITGLAAEDELLLSCCRTRLNPRALACAANSLAQPLDWDYIVKASILHGVSPLLYRGLEQVLRSTSVGIPDWTFERLGELTTTSAERNRRILALATELFAEFHNAGIPAMALKDAQLAWEVYPNIELRPMGDLDVLVPAEKYDAACRCLANLQFEPVVPGYRVLEYFWSSAFVRASDGMCVDLQWNIMQREWDNCGEGTWKFNLERMWSNARVARVGTAPVLMPKPEDLLFHLCVHLEGHGYCELVLFCDIAEFLHYYKGRIDWDYFLSLTRVSEVESSVRFTLLLAQQLLEAPVPEQVMCKLKSSRLHESLHIALFGNLSTLHGSLPRIKALARPPECAMRKFEVCARRQAFAARELYAVFNRVEQSFFELGGETLIFEGSQSEKLLLDDHLKSFEPITILVLDSQLDLLICALLKNRFAADSHSWHADWETKSRDPVLSHMPVRFRLDATLNEDWLSSSQTKHPTSLAKLALGVLLKSVLPVQRASDTVALQLRIVAVTAEQLALRIATQLALSTSDPLLAASPLSLLISGAECNINWKTYFTLASKHALQNSANRGLRTAWGLFSHAPLPTEVDTGVAPMRLFASARFGSDWGRYGDFRAAFFLIHSFLATQGVVAKLKYLFESVWHGKLLRKVFVPAILGALTSMMPKQERRPIVYWTRI